jgi:F-type H+-transporting ATPase subunit b
MESTLQALGGILLRAIPTFFLVLFLHVYLKKIFFQPLERVLAERDKATKGARAQAETSLARAAKLASEYEEAMRTSRADVYREQEQIRARWRDEQARILQEAKASAERQVAEARAGIASDAEAARVGLRAEAEAIATQIASRIVPRRAA